MKSLLLLFSFIFAQNVFAAKPDIAGTYSNEVNNKFEEVAKVYKYAGVWRIHFLNACRADLELKSKNWFGSCTTGKGLDEVLYSAKIIRIAGKSVLTFKVLEYGDDPQDTDHFATAVRR